MIYFDRIDVSVGTHVNKTSASKECDICHYLYFLNYSFKFQPNVCNRCHDLLMMSINLSKNETMNLMQNRDLTEKSRTLLNINNLFSYIRMGKEILTFDNT